MKNLLLLCGCLAALSPVARAERPADPHRVWQGIPGLERSAGGRVFLSWFSGGPKEPAPENEVLLSWSDDGAESFHPPRVMAEPDGGSRCYDPTLWIDPKGRLWYIFNRGNKDTAQHDVRARICDDPDAETPVFGAEFRLGYDVPFAFRMNKVTVLSSGEWLMPVTLARNPVPAWTTGQDDRQEPALQGVGLSTDEGRTWKLHGAVASRPWALENMIVELRDGRLWMLIRTSSGVLWQSHSADKGRTWSPGRPSDIASPGSRFFIRRLRSGHLLLVNHHKFSGRSHLTARLSTDDGATWNEGLLLDERPGVSYPDGVEDKEGIVRITYDRDRGGAGEILLATFKEEDVRAGKDVSGMVRLKQVVNRLAGPALLPGGWDPALAGDLVMRRLVRVTPPQAKGAHDAEFVCVGDRAYIVEHDNDVEPGHGAGAAMYCVLTVVHLGTLEVEKTHPLARAGERFANFTLPNAQIFVPRVIRKDADTLRTYFCSQPAKEQAVTWYRDFDLRSQRFEDSIHKARLQTAAGLLDMEPRHFHADAAALGFTKPPVNHGLFIFDSFKEFDGRRFVALNNFPGKQNALAVLHDDFTTFEVIGHYNEPQGEQLSESAVNRLPDGTWMAIVRNDAGNYHFTTSRDGKTWTVAEPKPFVPNGLNSKPTFDRFGGVYHLGWQENTRIGNCNRSVFNVDISRDGKTWRRKYRFETPHSFQYPTFHEHQGTIWLSVTQSDHGGSSDRIMFGKLETTGAFEPQAGRTRTVWPAPSPPAPPVMKAGVKLFTDRDYVIAALPEPVRDLSFHRTGIEKTEVEVTRSGTVFALSPTPRPGAASQETALQRAGFTRVPGGETQLFPGEINRVTLYRKEARAGERLRFSKMVVLVAGQGAGLAGRETVAPGPWTGNDGEVLPNGIVLPKVWPPDHRDPDSAEPMPVPYLRDPPPVIPIDIGRQLFTDDFLIEETTLKRTFHQAEKFAGNPVFRAETEMEKKGRNTVYLGQGGVFYEPEEKLFKMFYSVGLYGPLALATSPDLKTWTRPELGLHGGNILRPPGRAWGNGEGTISGSDNAVWYDIQANDPKERIKYLTCWMHVPKEQLVPGLTHSLQVSDGVTWSKPVPCTTPAGDYGSFFYNPFRKKWVQSIKKDTPRGRARYYVESDTFLEGANWNEWVYWTNADRLDLPEPAGSYAGNGKLGDPPQLYSLAAVAYESLMIGMHQIHRGPNNDLCGKGGYPKLTDLELGFSRDGFHWDRPDRRGFIRGERREGVWDRAYLHTTTGVVVVLDDQLVFPYCGYSGDAGGGRGNMYGGGAIGLATLRRDGFASMDGPGELTTRPVKFQGKHLFMNLDGEVRVEVLDEEGKLLAESPPQTVASTKRRIGWTGRSDLAAFAGRPVRFRFHLGKGALYAFWVTSDEGGASHGYVGAGGPAFPGTRDLGEP